jgi:MFS family permease
VVAVRLGFALFGGFWGTWAVAALDVQRFLELSDTGLGVLVAATVVGTSVANVVGGTLTERLGVGPAMVVSLGLWGASVVPLALVRSPAWWMAAFLVAVAAGGLLDVVLNVASTGALAHRPGRLLRVHSSYNAGALAGAGATGVLLAAGGSWRWPLAAVAVGAAVLAVPIARRRRHAALHEPPAHATLRDAALELRRSRLVSLAVVFALGAMVEGGIGTFGVLYLREHLDVAVLAGAGAYVAGQALATITRSALGSEGFAARLATGGGVRPARIGLCVAAAGLALEAATDLAAVAAVGLAVAAVGITTYWPLLSAVATTASDRPGLAVGGVSAAGYLGFLAGPPLVGALADGAGLRAGVLGLAVAAATAASIRQRDLSGLRARRPAG